MTSTLIHHIGELVTNDPARDGLLGIVEDAALVIEGGTVAWVGRAQEAPAGRRGVRRRRARRAPRLRRQPQPPGLRRRPGGGVRGPDGRRALRRGWHPHHRRRHPRGDRRAADQPRRPAGAGDEPPRHHHARDQERLWADDERRGPQPRDRPAVHRRDHLPRRARRPRWHRPGCLRRPGHRTRCWRLPARTRSGSTRSASGGPSTATRRARCSRPVGPPGCRGGCTPTSWVPDRASGWPRSSACSPSTTAPTSTTRTSTPCATPAPSPRCSPASSSRPGSPIRMPGGCSRPECGSRSPATATRAAASPARSRSASRSRFARWG